MEQVASKLDLQAEELRQDVVYLAQEVGERNFRYPEALTAAEHFIGWRWAASGLSTRRQVFEVDGQSFTNLEVELRGSSRPEEIVVLGAHYDTVAGSPGANSNGSGVAALLALAPRLQGQQFPRTLRLVAFANEEPPFARHRGMGSRVYARQAQRKGEAIRAMVCLESIGCRRLSQGSQRGALGGLLLPRRGDFLAVVTNLRYRRFLIPAVRGFARRSAVPIRALVLPSHLPGAWSSDHWSFWKQGFPALMLTDTAPLRYPWYHTPDDTPEKLDYAFLSQVVAGIEGVLEELLEGPP